jgi:hypothetical protein
MRVIRGPEAPIRVIGVIDESSYPTKKLSSLGKEEHELVVIFQGNGSRTPPKRH